MRSVPDPCRRKGADDSGLCAYLRGDQGSVGALRPQDGADAARLIEDALLQHLQALEALPGDVIVPARIVLGETSAVRVRQMIARPSAATKEMKRLFDDCRDPDTPAVG